MDFAMVTMRETLDGRPIGKGKSPSSNILWWLPYYIREGQHLPTREIFVKALFIIFLFKENNNGIKQVLWHGCHGATDTPRQGTVRATALCAIVGTWDTTHFCDSDGGPVHVMLLD